MAAVRRGHEPLEVKPPQKSSNIESSPLSALFLIHFDNKVGYTLGWRRAESDIELDGVVEYKSLPSGLHNVAEDLVYFVHGQHAGLSAFVNAPADEEDRNARMIAVGVLVPLSLGRLGRSWTHAEGLQKLAQYVLLTWQYVSG